MNRTNPLINMIYRGDCMKWTVRRYINNKPIEEYTEDERREFFDKATNKAFKKIGYKPIKA